MRTNQGPSLTTTVNIPAGAGIAGVFPSLPAIASALDPSSHVGMSALVGPAPYAAYQCDGSYWAPAGCPTLSSIVKSLGTRGRKRGTQNNELIVLNPGASLTIFDTTASPGPGCVTGIEFIAQNPAGAMLRDAYLDIYIDGASVPISMQMHLMGTAFMNAATDRYQCRHMYAANQIGNSGASAAGQAGFSYPIPFSTSCKIVWRATNSVGNVGSSGNVWSTVHYETGFDYGIRFGYAGLGIDVAISLNTTQQNSTTTPSVTFLQTARGTEGLIAGFTFCGYNASNFSYMEQNVAAYQGTQLSSIGSVKPFFNSTGLEDFFQSSFYFNNGGTQTSPSLQLPHGYASSLNTTGYNCTAHIDLLDAYEGIQYNDGVALVWEHGTGTLPGVPGGSAGAPGSSSTSVNVFYGVWHYYR